MVLQKRDWQKRSLNIDGIELSYIDEGKPDNETILLLHGYMGSHLTWRDHIEPLSQQYRVLALDWLGWGNSSRSATLNYDYETELNRLKNIIEKLTTVPINLFGHDYGGFLALGLTERFPAMVRRLALLNTRGHKTFKPTWYAVFGLMSWLGRVPGGTALAHLLPLKKIHEFGVRREINEGIIDQHTLDNYISWMANDPHGVKFLMRYFSHYRVAMRRELTDRLPEIHCPTMIIWGEQDIFLSTKIAKDLAKNISNATLKMLPVGHFVLEESPQEVQKNLLELLNIKVDS